MNGKIVTPYNTYHGDINLTRCFMEYETLDGIVPSFDYGVVYLENNTKPVVIIYNGYIKNRILFYVFTGIDNQKTYTPKINYNHHIDFGLSLETWDFLVQHNAVSEKIVDRMLLCPECQGIPTVRPGCPECGSSFTKPDQLVHHYACGNVDFLETFTISKKNGSLTCHKCNAPDLIINCDFDVSVGLYRCMECGWQGDGAKLIGHCLCCDTVFRMTEASEVLIKEYTLL
jgi:hypothetical protein